MTLRTTYTPLAQATHWAIVALVAFQFILSGIMPGIRRGQSPEFYVNLHMTFGVVVLPFVALLLWLRFYRPVDKPEMLAPTWQERAAVLMHYALYTLLIVIPFSGWAYATSRGWPVHLFGGLELPALFVPDSAFTTTFGHAHGLFATCIGILIAGHIAAALYHQFVLKDSILRRMVPQFIARYLQR